MQLLPRRRAALHTNNNQPRRAGVGSSSTAAWVRPSSLALLLLALCAALLPFILWQHSTLLQAPSTRQPPLTALQRLQLHKAAAARGQSHNSDADDPAATPPAQQHQQQGRRHAGAVLAATAEQAAAAQAYLQEVVLQPQRRHAVPAAKYVIQPEPHLMRQQLKQVKAYLASLAFAAKQAARAASGGRGIIINAGGPALVSSAVVTLKVLREVLNCTLPVELAWHSPSEMDAATLAALQARWGPVKPLDLASTPWPAHQRQLHSIAAAAAAPSAGAAPPAGEEGLPAERAAAKQKGFFFKVLSLSASSFASALLLDADNIPLRDPAGLWEDATFKLHGNLFWPDFWPPGSSEEALDVAYDMVGLDSREAEALLSAGKGPSSMSWRGTESGQVLLDLVRHAEVAELALWINSFGDSVYRALWGDKDTYALAFAAAGRAHEFNQLRVPPAAAFAWRPESVLVKATQAKLDGWQLAGMVQYDAWGQAAFLHRTMNKLSWDGQPWQIGLLTAPLPKWWLDYYLSLDSLGPTVGVPVTYAAPASAFRAVRIQQPSAAGGTQPPNISDAGAGGPVAATTSCPRRELLAYWQLRQQAVPVGPMPGLDAACAQLLATLLGPSSSSHPAADLISHPELLGIVSHDAHDSAAAAAAAAAVRPVDGGDVQQPTAESPGASPVAAWALQPEDAAPAGSSVAAVIQASYAAFAWMQQHAQQFPMLAHSSKRHALSSSSSGT